MSGTKRNETEQFGTIGNNWERLGTIGNDSEQLGTIGKVCKIRKFFAGKQLRILRSFLRPF